MTGDQVSQASEIEGLLVALASEFVDLPPQRKERVEALLQAIRACVSSPMPHPADEANKALSLEARTRLENNETAYRALAESITDPFVVYDANLRMIYRNKAAAEVTQIPDEQALGKTFAELYPEMVGTEPHQLYLRALETGQPQRYETRWVRPADDHTFYFDLSLYPTSSGLVATSKNVTDRVLAEQAQKEAHEQSIWMARLPDENPHPVARVSPAGKILYCNRESANASGWAFKPGAQVVEPFLSLIQAAYTRGERMEQDIQIGETFYAISIMPYPGDQYVNLYGMDVSERKRTETALAASERKYRELIQYAPTGIYEIDFRTGKFTAVNDSMAELTGYSREELLQMRGTDLLDEAGQQQFKERMRQWLAGERPNENVEYRVKAKDGHTIYAALNATFTKDAQGRPLGATVIGYDLSARKRAEEAIQKTVEALQKSEDKFAKAFHSSPMALAITRVSDGLFLDVNESHFLVSGYTRSEIIGHTGLELGLYTDPEKRAEIVKLLHDQGRVRNYEMETRKKTGEIITVLFSIEPFELDGEACMLATMIDITQRKQLEEARRESEARERARANELEALMDTAPAVIWISRDPECREMIGNRYSYEFLKIRQGENVSKTAPEEDLVVQQYRMEVNGRPVPVEELPLQIAAATGKPAKDYSFDLVYVDGTTYSMFGNVNPLLDQAGRPYGAIGVFVDLTNLRHLETEQMMAKAEIEVQRRLMDQREQERLAIARDLHDGPIQTLSSTIFNLQMIKDLFPDQALQVELSQLGIDIKNTIHEIREVLNDLRPPALMHFGFCRMIQIYTEDLRERYPDIEINLDVMDDNRVLSDQATLALYRIYQAGINNIIRHSGATKAWVTYKIEPDAFRLGLRDNGKGFDLTEDFTSLTRKGHFGLVGMKERAEAVGGTFSITSEPGGGTNIEISGPLLGKNLK